MKDYQSCGKCAFWERKLDPIGLPSSYGVCQWKVGMALPAAWDRYDMHEDMDGKHCQTFQEKRKVK